MLVFLKAGESLGNGFIKNLLAQNLVIPCDPNERSIGAPFQKRSNLKNHA